MVVYFRPNLTIIKSCWEEDLNREKSAKTVHSVTTWICCGNQQLVLVGREPWSSCYGRWLMIKRSSVWILALYTRWTWHFFTLICCKIVLMFVWKDPFKNTFSSEALFARKKAFNFAIKWYLRYKLHLVSMHSFRNVSPCYHYSFWKGCTCYWHLLCSNTLIMNSNLCCHLWKQQFFTFSNL